MFFDVDLAVLLFCITLAVEAVGWIGKDTLADIVWQPYSMAFGPPTSAAHRARKTEILKLRAELAATSSQDEFSKWARLRRKLDKAVADHESSSAQSTAAKQAFASSFKQLLWVLTTVMPFIVSSWHRKAAVFYLPPGWFGPATWWMGLPSAPTGGISCGIWTMACKRTIGTVKDIVVEAVGAREPPLGVKVPVSAAAEEPSEKVREKDEL